MTSFPAGTVSRAVIFDFGNTLARPEDSLALCRRCLTEMAIPHEAHQLAAALADEAISRRTAGTILETNWLACRDFHLRRSHALLAALGVTGHLAAKAAWLNALYEAHSLARTPHDGCHEALTAIDRAGWRMVVVSNSDGRVAARCAAMGIADDFAAIHDSAVLGVAKPDPEIFRIALRGLGLPAHRVVSVGDDPDNDVATPAALGMRTIHCRWHPPTPGLPGPMASPPPDAVITSLRQLPATLATLGID